MQRRLQMRKLLWPQRSPAWAPAPARPGPGPRCCRASAARACTCTEVERGAAYDCRGSKGSQQRAHIPARRCRRPHYCVWKRHTAAAARTCRCMSMHLAEGFGSTHMLPLKQTSANPHPPVDQARRRATQQQRRTTAVKPLSKKHTCAAARSCRFRPPQ